MVTEPDHGNREDGQTQRHRGLLSGFRANFLTGLIVVLPIGLTFWLIWNIIGWIDGWVLSFIPRYWQPDIVV